MAKQEDYDVLVRLLLVGDVAVGKTTLQLRFVDGEFFESPSPTIGVDFKTRIIEVAGKRVKMQIWDTWDQKLACRLGTFKGVGAVLFMYDITDENSFVNTENHIKMFKQEASALTSLKNMLIGNKSDLNEERKVDSSRGQLLAEENGLIFNECSGKTGLNVTELFEEIARQFVGDSGAMEAAVEVSKGKAEEEKCY
jgi:small GTP-binding protein